ncbi:NADH pyrophosphatase zinc ribbon domain-containing protein [Amaricoccus solimangrovi]|uniref:Primosomal protein N' (Replication factor Y)-superfamily II helicase n=1 Tax=Amaricoccus solimangrovi TaxID=2589815 RepID=A0A501WNS6_9RHOB|nr:NADH pyrophosphatase zinc ribbon domain-containing protein [Amaricoccus solimangrovi]TPE50502.1 primosomal protein N' (replication factor Y) - superfamily II helicase [Amaricoccus solimangrovi]
MTAGDSGNPWSGIPHSGARPWHPAAEPPPPPRPDPPASAGAATPEDHRFPCPACGAPMRFQPGTTALRCPHCGHEEPIPDARGGIPELDLRDAAGKAVPAEAMEELRVVQCQSCGAQVEFDPEIHAKVCPFCAAPIVTDTGARRYIKPQAQLPFLLTEEDARQAMNHWLGRLWFAPSDLRAYARAGRAMDGIYVPYWTYDAETRTRYSGQRGKVYYETRPVQVMVNGRMRTELQQVARVHWQPANGQVARNFDDVLVLGSKSLPKHYTDGIAPWDLSALSAYEPRFLAGFRSEGYTVPVEDAYGEAKAVMDEVIRQDIRRDIGGDQQRIGAMETSVGALTFKHVLLPVWVAAYRYRGRSYRFVVNGRTGAVEGERPWSSVKIFFLVLVMFLAAAAFAWFEATHG